MEKARISVIVPVYKVEPYLRRCLDSIVAQTCRELEILLVDDGSPDGCGAICDEYAARDGRIRVIHKPNGGVSSARNAGLAAATAEWIGWVDSDDWIEPDFFQYLLENALARDAEIVCGGRLEEWSDGSRYLGPRGEEVLDGKQAVALLLEDRELQNYLWDKLWRRELFQGERFPQGKNFEDVAMTARIFRKAKRVALLPEAKYHYRMLSTSIVGSHVLRDLLDLYDAMRDRMDQLAPLWPDLEPALAYSRVAAAVGVWCYYCANPRREREAAAPKLREIAAFCGEHARDLRARGMGAAGRMVALVTPHAAWWAFAWAWLVGRLYRLRHGRGM